MFNDNDKFGGYVLIVCIALLLILLTGKIVLMSMMNSEINSVKDRLENGERISGQEWFSISEKHRYEILYDISEYRKFEREHILEN